MEGEQTSLRYLQLKDAFRRMVVLGVDATDKQTFSQIMKDVPKHYWGPLWELYRAVVTTLVQNATAEFDDACREVDLQGQLAELEGLCLQRGRPVSAEGPQDPDAVPHAAELSVRVAAKQHELKQLKEAIEKAEAAKQELSKQMVQQQLKVQQQKENIQAVAQSVTEVYQGGRQWMVAS